MIASTASASRARISSTMVRCSSAVSVSLPSSSSAVRPSSLVWLRRSDTRSTSLGLFAYDSSLRWKTRSASVYSTRLRAFASDTIQEPRLGVGTTADSTGTLVVTYVDPEGALAAAGVQVGDQLVSIGEVPVSDESFGARFRAKYARANAGTALPIGVRRAGRDVSLSAKLVFAPRVVRHVRIDAKASAKATRIRNGILRGVTEK